MAEYWHGDQALSVSLSDYSVVLGIYLTLSSVSLET